MIAIDTPQPKPLIAVAPMSQVNSVAVPTQGTMNLTNSVRSGSVSLVQAGAVTTLTFGNANVGQGAEVISIPALPMFNVAPNKPVIASNIVVKTTGDSISMTVVQKNDSAVNAGLALSSVNQLSSGTPTAQATITMPDGSLTNVTVGVTREGILVVRVPEQAADVENSKGVGLIAMVTAKDALGVLPQSLKGVVIQSEAVK